MTTLVTVLGLSFACCLLLTPIARALAVRSDLVDRPDGLRKIHAKAVPMGGGIAVLLSIVAAIAVTLSVSSSLREHLGEQSRASFGLFFAAVAICILGLADDSGGLRGRHK